MITKNTWVLATPAIQTAKKSRKHIFWAIPRFRYVANLYKNPDFNFYEQRTSFTTMKKIRNGTQSSLKILSLERV